MGRLVRHMLFSSYEKPGVPVPRTKLNDLLVADNKNHKSVKKLLARSLPEAQVIGGGVSCLLGYSVVLGSVHSPQPGALGRGSRSSSRWLCAGCPQGPSPSHWPQSIVVGNISWPV